MLPNKRNPLESSYQFFSSLQTRKEQYIEMPPQTAKNADFGPSFPGQFINKPYYENCRFNGSVFERPAGELSRFHSCGLFDCKITDADFRYCDFYNTKIESHNDTSIIYNSNFSFGMLVDTKFISTNIKGTPFREMLIDNCLFKDCIFDSFGFERSTIKNCTFENIDMSKIVFRFCDFENVHFNNVTLHILDLAKNYGLINELCENGNNIQIFYGKDNYISLDKAISMLPKLIPYYLNEKEFYYVINILMSENKANEIWELLPNALDSVIKRDDFAGLQDLCSLIVKFNVFNKYQLSQIYNIICLKATPNNMPLNQLKSYSYHLRNIKGILIENPQNFPTATITFSTNIMPYDVDQLSPLLKYIEQNIYENFPSVAPKIQISHHSPYEVEVLVSALLPELLTICQMFYYTFGGIKALKDIISSRHEKALKKVTIMIKR